MCISHQSANTITTRYINLILLKEYFLKLCCFQNGDGWLASEGTCRNCGSPRRMPRTEHSGNQEFRPRTLPLLGKGEEAEGKLLNKITETVQSTLLADLFNQMPFWLLLGIVFQYDLDWWNMIWLFNPITSQENNISTTHAHGDLKLLLICLHAR